MILKQPKSYLTMTFSPEERFHLGMPGSQAEVRGKVGGLTLVAEQHYQCQISLVSSFPQIHLCVFFQWGLEGCHPSHTEGP